MSFNVACHRVDEGIDISSQSNYPNSFRAYCHARSQVLQHGMSCTIINTESGQIDSQLDPSTERRLTPMESGS